MKKLGNNKVKKKLQDDIENKKSCKKSAVKKTRRKRRKNKRSNILIRRMCIVLGIAISSIAIIGSIVFSMMLLVDYMFKIRKVEVKGSSKYKEEEIIELSGVNSESNLITYNSGQGINNIMSNLPYAENVRIRKEIPSKVVISLDTAEPKYTVELEGGNYALISDKNKVLEFFEEPPEGILLIRGLNILSAKLCEEIEYQDDSILYRSLQVIDSFTSNEMTDIKSIDVSNINSVTVNYENRVNIILGSFEDIEYKVLTAKEILKNKIDSHGKGKLDLTSCKCENRSYFTPDYIKN